MVSPSQSPQALVRTMRTRKKTAPSKSDLSKSSERIYCIVRSRSKRSKRKSTPAHPLVVSRNFTSTRSPQSSPTCPPHLVVLLSFAPVLTAREVNFHVEYSVVDHLSDLSELEVDALVVKLKDHRRKLVNRRADASVGNI